MKNQQQPQTSMIEDFKQSTNVALWVCEIHAWALYLFIRSGMGTRGIGWTALIAGFGIAALATETHSSELLVYWYLWMAFAIWRRLTSQSHQISTYEGWPWLAQLLTLGLCRSELFLRRLEPFICAAAGALLNHWSPVVGKFVGLGFVSLTLKHGFEAKVRDTQRIAASDAWKLAQQHAEMLKHR